jgi:hypothetical protein
MGIVITCFMRFLARSEKERMPIKLLVYFVTFVAACVGFPVFCPHTSVSVFLTRNVSFPMQLKTGYKRERRSLRGGRYRCRILAIGWVKNIPL